MTSLLLPLLLLAAAASPCPAELGKLARKPGAIERCGAEGALRARAFALPRPYDGHAVIRRWDPAPLALGGVEAVSFLLRKPDGTVTQGQDVTDLLRAGKLAPASPAEAALLITASLLGAFDELHGPAQVEQSAALAKAVAHLPPPYVKVLPNGGYELLFYGRNQQRGPGSATRRTIDQVRVRLVPDQARWLATPELGRIHDQGQDGDRRWDAWRPDSAPPAPAAEPGAAPKSP